MPTQRASRTLRLKTGVTCTQPLDNGRAGMTCSTTNEEALGNDVLTMLAQAAVQSTPWSPTSVRLEMPLIYSIRHVPTSVHILMPYVNIDSFNQRH